MSVYVLKPIVDEVFISRDYWMLWAVIIALPVIVGLKACAAYIQNYLMSWIGQRVTQEIREDLFRHLHRLSLDYFLERKSGEVLARVTNDLTIVQSMLNFIPLYLVRDSLTLIVLMGVLFFLNWKFALLALLGIPVAAVTLIVLGKKMRDASLKSQAIMGHIYHRFQESLQGMLLIKTFNYEEGALEKFKEENLSFFQQMMRYLRATALAGPLMEFAGSLILALLIYYGGSLIIDGTMTPGAFFAFLGAFFAAYAPTKNLAKANSELQRGLASGERIFQILDERPTILERSNGLGWSGLADSVRLVKVSFRYHNREKWALREVSLEIRKGEVVGLVGPSGSGKTTLVHMLLRLYDPSKGIILFDGTDLKDLDTKQVRARTGIVTQDTLLFNDTIFQNVALGLKGVTPDRVEEACRIADAHEFITLLPQGYHTVVGERGLQLSGGQRQRLAIARAVLKDPSFLILDEATSNLDSSSEKAVQAAVARLMKGRTVLIIAHRLSTLQNADRIAVLNQGELVETGGHAELLARGGVYRQLYELQSRPMAIEVSSS